MDHHPYSQCCFMHIHAMGVWLFKSSKHPYNDPMRQNRLPFFFQEETEAQSWVVALPGWLEPVDGGASIHTPVWPQSLYFPKSHHVASKWLNRQSPHHITHEGWACSPEWIASWPKAHFFSECSGRETPPLVSAPGSHFIECLLIHRSEFYKPSLGRALVTSVLCFSRPRS